MYGEYWVSKSATADGTWWRLLVCVSYRAFVCVCVCACVCGASIPVSRSQGLAALCS